MRTADFLIPSVLREFTDWALPTLAHDAADLLLHVDLGPGDDPEAAFSELSDLILRNLEPVLILVALTGHRVDRLIVAGDGAALSPSYGFDPSMKVSAVLAADIPAALTAATPGGGAVLGLELSPIATFATPLPAVVDGWLPIPVSGVGSPLDVVRLLTEMKEPVEDMGSDLVDTIVAEVGSLPLDQLRTSDDVAAGLISAFDARSWFIPSLDEPTQDATTSDDADALALLALGETMQALIDQGLGLEQFLRQETARGQPDDTVLRDRFGDSREDRQLLRRAMRGARRRSRKLTPAGHQHAFRFGRSRKLTYTELMIGCHVQEVADVIRLQPGFDATFELAGDIHGEPDEQYVIGRLPTPREPPLGVEVRLVDGAQPTSGLELQFKRWGVVGRVDDHRVSPADLSLASGTLPSPLQLVDGAGATPSVDLDGGRLVVSGVQHADVMILFDPASGASAEFVVVKNFSANDLDRLAAAGLGLTVAPPYDQAGDVGPALIRTIEFALDGSSDQDRQRQELLTSFRDGTDEYPDAGSDPSKAYPAELDIPSAMGVGALPVDLSGFHTAHALPGGPGPEALHAAYRADAESAAAGLSTPTGVSGAESAAYRAEVADHHGSFEQRHAEVLTDFAAVDGATLLCTGYGSDSPATWAPPDYVDPAGGLALWPGDPIRNMRTDLGGQPQLLACSSLTDPTTGYDPVSNPDLDADLHAALTLGGPGFFVNHRAQLVMYDEPGGHVGHYGAALQVADALAGQGAVVDPAQTPGIRAEIYDDVDWVDQLVVVEPDARAHEDFTTVTFATRPELGRLRPAPEIADLETADLVRPVGATGYLLKRNLRIVHPVDPADPTKILGWGRLPVVFIVHGNHLAWYRHPLGHYVEHDNHEGYTYLQEHLAEHHIISVSIDTNAANYFGSHVEMRAQMVLGAMDDLRELDADPTTIYNGRLDLDNVGLLGHSRGGDAVVRVADLNALRGQDEFGIQVVCSLAPTDVTGTRPVPGFAHTLRRSETAFYAVVYGALDSDVAGWGGATSIFGTGFRHYDRAETDKAMVFLAGCNHNRFNTVWAADGDDWNADPLDHSRLLSNAQVLDVTTEYVGGLFRWRLLGETALAGLFDGSTPNTWAGLHEPKAAASLQWSFGERVVSLDDMEDAARARTLADAYVERFADVVLGTGTLDSETNHQTSVLVVEPPTGAPSVAYEIHFDALEGDWSDFDTLIFRVAAEFDLRTSATIGTRIPEFEITLTDDTPPSVVIPSASLATPAGAPSVPIHHEPRLRDRFGAVVRVENCSTLRLETLAVDLTSLVGIDRGSMRSLAITSAAGFPARMFFDSIELVRR